MHNGPYAKKLDWILFNKRVKHTARINSIMGKTWVLCSQKIIFLAKIYFFEDIIFEVINENFGLEYSMS